MNPTSEYKNLDHVFVCRSSERRSGIENRASELVKNKDLRQAAEMLEKSQSLVDTKFCSKFGWF
jgi:hypothetical protein